jgi:hypothetical protein
MRRSHAASTPKNIANAIFAIQSFQPFEGISTSFGGIAANFGLVTVKVATTTRGTQN